MYRSTRLLSMLVANALVRARNRGPGVVVKEMPLVWAGNRGPGETTRARREPGEVRTWIQPRPLVVLYEMSRWRIMVVVRGVLRCMYRKPRTPPPIISRGAWPPWDSFLSLTTCDGGNPGLYRLPTHKHLVLLNNLCPWKYRGNLDSKTQGHWLKPEGELHSVGHVLVPPHHMEPQEVGTRFPPPLRGEESLVSVLRAHLL